MTALRLPVSVESGGQHRLAVVTQPGKAFWILHIAGWAGISLLTYLSLSLPYDQFEPRYLAHNVLQSVLGMFISLPMRYWFRHSWQWPLPIRAFVVVVATLLLSALWATLRLELFILVTQERTDLWTDFGGWLFPSIFVFATWAALYHVIKYYQLLQSEQQNLIRLESERRREALKLAQAESAARDAQLQLLRYQLNPHFLFNTLNSVAALINSDRTKDAGVMVNRLGSFLRYTLDGQERLMVTVEHEINALSQYLAIEKIRFSDRLEVTLDIDPLAKPCKVPSLIVQPVVENSIKHALGRAERAGEIRVSARLSDHVLSLTVEDSGPADRSASELARISEQMLQQPGVGMANIRARLENLYGAQAYVTTGVSDLGGLAVAIQLPIQDTPGYV